MSEDNDLEQTVETLAVALKDLQGKVDKKGSFFKTYDWAHTLMANHRFMTVDEKGPLWHYEESEHIWKTDGSKTLKLTLTGALGKKWTKAKQDSIVAFVKAATYKNPVDLGGPSHRIVLLNGTYDTNEYKFYEGAYDPNEYQTIRIPVLFDPKANCPNFKERLKQWLPDEHNQLCIGEWLGYHLVKSYFLAVFLVLLGGGANGKSTLLEIMDEFLGKENVSGCSLKKLITDKFKARLLYLRLGNVSGDIGKSALIDTSMLKRLTGRDKMIGEKKYGDEFDFYNYAKLTFAANELPRTYDDTLAFHRRCRFIKFEQVFPSEDENTIDREVLVAEMSTPEEKSGIFNLAIEGLKRLRQNKALSGMPPAKEQKWANLYEGDSIRYFQSRYLIHDVGEGFPKGDLYDLHTKWSLWTGTKSTSPNWFSTKLKKTITFWNDVGNWNQKRMWYDMSINWDLLYEEGKKFKCDNDAIANIAITQFLTPTATRIKNSSKEYKDSVIAQRAFDGVFEETEESEEEEDLKNPPTKYVLNGEDEDPEEDKWD